MGRFLILGLALCFFWISTAQAQVAEPPLPPDLKIIPPGPGVSPALAQLSGIWEGAWDFKTLPGGGLKKLTAMDSAGRGVKIALIEINPPMVKAIYAQGGAAGNPGKWFQVPEASVSGDTIVLRWGQPGRKKTVILSPSGSPGVARATLQDEDSPKVLTTTLRKK